MHRREFIQGSGVGAALLVAGCISESGDGGDTGDSGSGDGGDTGDSESGDGGDTGDSEGAGAEDSLAPPTLESHDVLSMTGGYEMVVTMTNETEILLNRAIGEVAIYQDNTRLADGRAAVIDLEPGIKASESALLAEFNPADVTRYTITMSGETEDYEETETEEHEFDGDEFRDRLSG